MSDNLIIRQIAPSDFTQWSHLWNGYNNFYGYTGATALSDHITQTTWTRFFDTNEPMHALVAEKDQQLLGLVHYLFHRSTTTIEPTCYLRDLFTEESARGQGIGRALIESVYDHAKDAGLHTVYWQTHETNITGMKLYDKVAERSGFVIYSKQI